MKKLIYPPRTFEIICSVVIIAVGVIFKCLNIQHTSNLRYNPQLVVYLGIVIFLIKFRFVVITEDAILTYYFAGFCRRFNRSRVKAVELYNDDGDYYLVITPDNTIPFSLSGRSFAKLCQGWYLKYMLIYIPKGKIYATMEFLKIHYPDCKYIMNRNTLSKHL